MDILKSDFKKGTVKLRITDLDDLWYLQSLIDPGDFLTGKTTRKIRIGDTDTTVKKTMTVQIEAETIEFSASGTELRINGKVKEAPEEVPRDSYHSLSLEEGSECILEKVQWLSYQKQKLEEAATKSYMFLLCLFDREEALFALTKKSGYEILLQLQGEVQKKRKDVAVKKDFQEEIIKALEQYAERYTPERIILASPAFYKEDLYKRITSPELKKSIVLAGCSSVSPSALDEVIRQPELKEVLKDSRARQEKELMDEVLRAINEEGKVAYGWEEVKQAIDAGAVSTLLLTNNFIQGKKQAGEFLVVDEFMKKVEALKGETHLLSAQLESGKTLDGLGGIAALLRYKIA